MMDGIRREKKKGARGRLLALLICLALLCGQLGSLAPAAAMEAEPASEIPAEPEGQEETAVSKPEFSFSADLDGVTVCVHAAEGLLPEGTTAGVYMLPDGALDTASQSVGSWSAGKTPVQLLGFAIRFFDAEGVELAWLEQEIDVTCSGLTFVEDAAELQVFHTDADGNVTEALTDVLAVSSEVKFSSHQASPILVAAYGSEEETEPASDGQKAGNGIMTAALEEDQNDWISLTEVGGSRAANDATQSPTISKTAIQNENGTYTLDLTVSGMVGSETSPAMVDIVIVIDNSGSMGNDNRLSDAQTAANSLITALDENEGINARYNIISFSGKQRTENKEVDSTTIMNEDSKSYGWTEDAATAKNNANTIVADGGTNYEAGLLQAQEQLKGARQGATTIVIFLTDGNPTLRCSNKQAEKAYTQTYYYGTGYEGDSNSYNINAAKNAVAAITMNRFYVVGTGSADSDTLNALANAATNAGTTSVLSTSSGNLTSIFNDIAADITTFLCTNVTVTDTLSRNSSGELMVQPVEGATAKVTVLKSDGTVVVGPAESVNLSATEKNAAATISASYENGTLKLVFPSDYQLEPDYIYKLSIDIEPTEAVYAAYRANNLTYPNTGDAGTGTHADDSGFYCNGDATLTYSYRGTEGSMEYPKPVVQLNPGKLIVTKTITGLEGDELTALQSALTFTVSYNIV